MKPPVAVKVGYRGVRLLSSINYMNKPIIFISHISEEAELAAILKKHLTADFLGLVDIFVSSDMASILAGHNWLNSIETALRMACIELIICSRSSIKRPWINFEAGAGWMRSIPIVPICHSGLHPRDLPMPMSVLQAIEANQEAGLDQIYTLVATNLGSVKPKVKFGEIVEEVKAFEDIYAVKLKETTRAEDQKEKAALTRMKDALRESEFTWRSIERLASIGGVSEGEALDILRGEYDVVFGRGKSGGHIVKLKSLDNEDTKPEPKRELFCDPEHWDNLLVIGDWNFNVETGVISGSGVFNYLLSQNDYGARPFTIKSRLRFYDYRHFAADKLETANAGIILGWQQDSAHHSYFNILFSGRRILLEAIGFNGGDDYLDAFHLEDGVEFDLEEERLYALTISVSSKAIVVFVDNKKIYFVETPHDLLGRVGIRPWRSRIDCAYLEVYEQ